LTGGEDWLEGMGGRARKRVGRKRNWPKKGPRNTRTGHRWQPKPGVGSKRGHSGKLHATDKKEKGKTGIYCFLRTICQQLPKTLGKEEVADMWGKTEVGEKGENFRGCWETDEQKGGRKKKKTQKKEKKRGLPKKAMRP